MSRQWMKMAALAGAIGMSGLLRWRRDVSGNWIAQIATQGEPQYARVSLKVDGTA